LIQATLVTDGSSDVVLVRILEWLMTQLTHSEFEVRWADLRSLRRPPNGLGERLLAATELYDSQILFVHRDAEAQLPDFRYREVAAANQTGIAHVCVVPVRMQEAWLLHDEDSLRRAADRPSGTEALEIPPPHRWEELSDPKQVLHRALRTANGATGRRAKKFNPGRAAHRLAELITDWSPLRSLTAFARLEADTRAALRGIGVSVNG
jgi:hypothetical protein